MLLPSMIMLLALPQSERLPASTVPSTAITVEAKRSTDADALSRRSSRLEGLSVVIGLNATSDARAAARVALVAVSVMLPHDAKAGTMIEVSIEAIDGETALDGGHLLQTSLRGADGEVYVVAQGPVVLDCTAPTRAPSSVTQQRSAARRWRASGVVETPASMTLCAPDDTLDLHVELRAANPGALTGAAAEIERIASNLANVNTAGFKRAPCSWEAPRGSPCAKADTPSPDGFAPGPRGANDAVVEPGSMPRDFCPGVLEQTDRALDLAILGNGLFEVELPNGQKAYTRDGGLRLDEENALVTARGFKICPPIVVPADVDGNVSIAPDGVITARRATTGASVQIGELKIACFSNPSGLRWSANLFYATASSGTATRTTPGENGTGTLAQNLIERSNVCVVDELLNLVNAVLGAMSLAEAPYEFSPKPVKPR